MALWMVGLGYEEYDWESQLGGIENLQFDIETGNIEPMSVLGRLLTFHGLPFPPRTFQSGLSCTCPPTSFRDIRDAHYEGLLRTAKAYRRDWEVDILVRTRTENEALAAVSIEAMHTSKRSFLRRGLGDPGPC